MKPKEPQDFGQLDAFRSRLDQIIDMRYPKVILAKTILPKNNEVSFFGREMRSNHSDFSGHPTLSTRLDSRVAHP